MKKNAWKILFLLLGLVLIGSCVPAFCYYCPDGVVINYEGNFLVLEKGTPRSQDQKFIHHLDEQGTYFWYKVDARDYGEVYIVKDTIIAISPLVNEAAISSTSGFSTYAYSLWKNRKVEHQRISWSQTNNLWLTLAYTQTREVVVYYDKNKNIIDGVDVKSTETRFPWENIGLFIFLFILGIVIRNAFNNYKEVSIWLIVLLYLIIPAFFLMPRIFVFQGNIFEFQYDRLIFELSISILFVMSIITKYWRVKVQYKTIVKRASYGFIAILSMSTIVGINLWIALNHWQFLLLSLIAGLTAYFIPFFKGKFRPLTNFVLTPSEKLEG